MKLERVGTMAAIAVAVFAAGCQLKSATVPPNFVTVEPSQFVLHSVDRYYEQQGMGSDSMIVVVKATYTNTESSVESISPSKFELLDPNLMATYYGLSGGNINVPTMPDVRLDPGKTAEIAVGFRVPTSMTTARLTYRP